MKRIWQALAWGGLSLLLMMTLAGFQPATRVHAAPSRASVTSDTLQLSMANGSTFTYGDTPPVFTAVLQLAQPFTDTRGQIMVVTLDDGQTFSNTSPPNSSADRLTYTFSVSSTTSSTLIPPGAHTAVATFNNIDTGTTSTSNTVSLTVNKAPFTLGCSPNNSGLALIKAGQPQQFVFTNNTMATSMTPPIDWTQGTATISFTGPATFTYSNLNLDSSGKVTITLPSQTGRYNLGCHFSGTQYYDAGDMQRTQLDTIVSQMLPLGGIQVYSNPTSITSNHSTTLYIVFRPAAGAPMPTGEFSLSIDTSPLLYTNSMSVNSNGTMLVTITPQYYIGSGNSLTVQYFGDTTYANQYFKFPMTNPPIPGNGGGAGTSGTGATSAKATATPKPTATVGQTDNAGTGSTTGTGTQPSTPTTSDESQLGLFSVFGPAAGIALWIVIILCVALAGGVGYGVYYWLSHRMPMASAPVGQADNATDISSQWNTSSLDEQTMPRRRIDY